MAGFFILWVPDRFPMEADRPDPVMSLEALPHASTGVDSLSAKGEACTM
jgi:hypothetical protein